jgi:hypothetical protein
MSDQQSLQAQPQQLEGDFSFDLARISLDEMLDILDVDTDNISVKQVGRIVRALKKCLVKGNRELTGADLKPVLEGFMTYMFGGDETAKN